MDIKEARAVCKSAANMLRVFAQLEAAAETVITATNLQAERATAIEEVGRKLEQAKTAYEAEVATNRATLGEIGKQIAYAKEKHVGIMSELSQKQADAEAAVVAAIAVARNKQASAEDECQRAIDLLQSRKDELEKAVKNIESRLESLKSKVGAL